jgi:hypothetical protein
MNDGAGRSRWTKGHVAFSGTLGGPLDGGTSAGGVDDAERARRGDRHAALAARVSTSLDDRGKDRVRPRRRPVLLVTSGATSTSACRSSARRTRPRPVRVVL